MTRETGQSPDDFWQEYEAKIGEKITARSLGHYLSGWQEFDGQGLANIWGLIISTPRGFRFHHFPQQSWIRSFGRNPEAIKEKILFIPRERIISAQLIEENSWFKKLLKSSTPKLVVNYRDEADIERQLLLEADLIKGDLLESLNA
jgi:hypothetical protein